jgi:hypothetical protein
MAFIQFFDSQDAAITKDAFDGTPWKVTNTHLT